MMKKYSYIMLLGLFVYSPLIGQTSIENFSDTTVIGLDLRDYKPKFEYFNDKIDCGILLTQVVYREVITAGSSVTSISQGRVLETTSYEYIDSSKSEEYTVRSEFKDSLAHGIWVAEDTNGIIRLFAVYNEGVVQKVKLFSETGSLLRLIEFENAEIVYEEWYNNEKLIQVTQKIENNGFLTTAFYENYHKRMEYFLHEDYLFVRKIIHYDINGQITLIEER